MSPAKYKAVTPPPLTMEEYPPLQVSPNPSKAITPLSTCKYNSYLTHISTPRDISPSATGNYYSYINHLSTPIPIHIHIESYTILLFTANTQVSPAPPRYISPSATGKYNYSLTHISTSIPIHIDIDSYTILHFTANIQVSTTPSKDISPSLLVTTTPILTIYPTQFISMLT